jgi:3-oxosteroid 1-dehydrogenase
MASIVQDWDHEVDVLVAGSGAGGMAAALAAHDAGLSALVVEKAEVYGGSTALSGGGIWIPDNPTLRRLGRGDDVEDVRRYLAAVVGDRVPRARLDAYAEHGPAAMEMLERVSRHMRFSWCPGYSDYHPLLPGGRPLGRTVEPRPFDTRKLGEDEKLLRASENPAPMGLWMTAADAPKLILFKRTWTGKRMLLVAAWRVLSTLVTRRHVATLGQALIARMRLTLKELEVPLWLGTPIVDLVLDEDGAVAGAIVERDGQRIRVRARKGVVLATGGFERDVAMRKQYLPEGGKAVITAGAPSNVGDGQRLGERYGVGLDLMDDAWWMPSIVRPSGTVFPLVSERCIPPMVIVNQHGVRFTNESAPYVNFVHDQLEGGHGPIYEIFGAKAKARYQFGGVLPGKPFRGSWYKSKLVTSADTLAELAEKIQVPASALEATVERFNGFARDGHDEDFGRGDSPYDRYYGDPTLRNPNIDEIGPGPYYAIRLEVGDLGTKGGLTCDEHGQVLRADGSALGGLYATGNVSASVMGNEYPGAGGTIGPAIVFGYRAVQHAKARGA